MSENEKALRIGELAQRGGTSVAALRYYERIGLLPQALRSEGGMRRYGDDAVERLAFIKQAQRNGLSLADIRSLLAFRDRGGANRCRQVLGLLRERISGIEGQVRELRAFRGVLQRYATQCERAQQHSAGADCPVVFKLGEQKSGPLRKRP